MNGELQADQALKTGIAPLRQFMVDQTRDSDMHLFASIAGRTDIATADDAPLSIVVSSFMVRNNAKSGVARCGVIPDFFCYVASYLRDK